MSKKLLTTILIPVAVAVAIFVVLVGGAFVSSLFDNDEDTRPQTFSECAAEQAEYLRETIPGIGYLEAQEQADNSPKCSTLR